MESDLRDNTLFLEFYGLPGSGKSTISHMVADELRKKGKTVIEPTYNLDHKYSASFRKVIKMLTLIKYATLYPIKYKSLLALIRKNGLHGFCALSHAANIAPKLWQYEYARTGIVIFDEGLTQSAISLVSNDVNSSDNEKTLFNLCKKRTVIKYYIKVTIESAFFRLASRDKHDSRIERINSNSERNIALKNFKKQCDDISFGYVIQEDSVQKAVQMIVNHVISKESIN